MKCIVFASILAMFVIVGLICAGDYVPLHVGVGGGSKTSSEGPGGVITLSALDYYRIQAAQASTVTVAAATSVGRIITIENIVATNITIADNGTTMALGADVVLGKDDILMLINSASNQWRKVALADN